MRLKNNENRIKVYRTMEGNIFEAMAAIIVIIMWVVTMNGLQSIDQTVIISMSEGSNEAGRILVNSIIGTAAVLLCLVAAYFPDRMINIHIKLHNTAQYSLIIRMARVMALEMGLAFLGSAADPANKDSIYPILLVIALCVTLVVFRTLIKRKG